MIIKCNKCLYEYETEFEVVDQTVYNCECCSNIQILEDIAWKNITQEQVDKLEY